MSEKSIYRTIQLIVVLGMVLGLSATSLAGWDESQEFGEFSYAEIYQGDGSVWIKGAASSFDYRPFQFREGTWSTHDDLPMERDHSAQLTQGSSHFIQTLTENYQISYENTSVIIRKGTDDYAAFTVYEHTCGVNMIDVSGDKVLLNLVLGYGDIFEDDESLDKSQLLVHSECYLYSMRLVMFDFATKEWFVYPTPPINSWITCGVIYDSYLLLGTCDQSEMGTAYTGDGIAIFDIKQENYIFINSKNSPLVHDGIIDMKIIGDELWIVNVKSIQRVNLTTHEWSTYIVDKNIILKTDVDVVLNQTDKNIETLKAGSIVPAGLVYSRMCSVPLVGRYYGYVEATEKVINYSMSKINDVDMIDLCYLSIYKDPSTDSSELPLMTESGLSYKVIGKEGDWFRIEIDQGWISQKDVWPRIITKEPVVFILPIGANNNDLPSGVAVASEDLVKQNQFSIRIYYYVIAVVIILVACIFLMKKNKPSADE